MVTDPVMSMIEYVGIIAFAVSGAIIAIQRKMDLLGVVILAVTTALGGGFVRDMMLGITPPWMFVHSEYALLAALTALVVFVLVCVFGPLQDEDFERIDGFINMFDALGLGAFAISGVNTAMNCGYQDNVFLCVFVGVLSSVGGGMLRDIFSAVVPFVLQKRIYALVCIAASLIYYYLCRVNAQAFGVFIAMGLTVLLRYMAAKHHWSLPHADSFRKPR